jgi:hypothetical protein
VEITTTREGSDTVVTLDGSEGGATDLRLWMVLEFGSQGGEKGGFPEEDV